MGDTAHRVRPKGPGEGAEDRARAGSRRASPSGDRSVDSGDTMQRTPGALDPGRADVLVRSVSTARRPHAEQRLIALAKAVDAALAAASTGTHDRAS